MAQTSFPSTAIFGTGPFLVGKSTNGFGLGAEISASTLRSAFSLQETLASGTNIKTVNGSSILGSGNLTVSASPAGSSTQLQFNSSGSLAGTSRLAYGDTTGLGMVATEPSYPLWQISPPVGASYTHNVPFIVNGQVTDNGIGSLASGVSAYNFVVNQGFNINSGGGLADPNYHGIGQYFESNYITNRRGFNERLLEYHLIVIPRNTATNTTAGNQIRFFSAEILTAENAATGASQAATPLGITCYFTCGNLNVRAPDPTHTEGIFDILPGQFSAGDGLGARLTIGIDATYAQYSLTGVATHLFSQTVSSQGDVIAGVRLRAASTASDSIIAAGGVEATKAVRSNLSLVAVLYSLTGQSEPDAIGGGMQLYGKVYGDFFIPHVRMGGDAVAPLWYSRRTSSASTPSTTELPTTNMMCIHTNTNDSKVYLAINDGGAIKKVELT